MPRVHVESKCLLSHTQSDMQPFLTGVQDLLVSNWEQFARSYLLSPELFDTSWRSHWDIGRKILQNCDQ